MAAGGSITRAASVTFPLPRTHSLCRHALGCTAATQCPQHNTRNTPLVIVNYNILECKGEHIIANTTSVTSTPCLTTHQATPSPPPPPPPGRSKQTTINQHQVLSFSVSYMKIIIAYFFLLKTEQIISLGWWRSFNGLGLLRVHFLMSCHNRSCTNTTLNFLFLQ